MASLKGFDPAESGQTPVDLSGDPVPVGVWGDSTSGLGVFGTSGAPTSNQDNIPIGKLAGVTGHGVQTIGVRGESIELEGVSGRSKNFIGVSGFAADSGNPGVFGQSAEGGAGVRGVILSETGIGVHGRIGPVDLNRDLPKSAGVFGDGGSGDPSSFGVYGISDQGKGVHGESKTKTGIGVEGSGNFGVVGIGVVDPPNPDSVGVRGHSDRGGGVQGSSDSNIGVLGTSNSQIGVVGLGDPFGVRGASESDRGGGVQGVGTGAGVGVSGSSGRGIGVHGASGMAVGPSDPGIGVLGTSDVQDGVRGHGLDEFHAGVAGLNFGSGQGIFGQSTSGLAGDFNGNVRVTGTIVHAFASSKIDHPLDPENRYLYHSSVESPDMLNVYNGNTTTDANGDAIVKMPDYFEALNHDFRYQLTVIEQFAQAIVASEIMDNSFVIKTDKPHVKVSWMVTGIRQDTYANAQRISVEEDKPVEERGRYLHPELRGQPKEAGIVRWSVQPQNQLHQVSHSEPEPDNRPARKAKET
jgi:hypothetical protein